MIYTDDQLIQHIREMIEEFENEVVEFKEAKLNYSFKDIGKYFQHLEMKPIFVERKSLGLFLV